MLLQLKKNQVNSQRSIDVTISGIVDPSVVAVDAKAGTRYNQLVAPFNSYIKLDNGSTTNWVLMGGAVSAAGVNVYVDGVNGDDTNNGSIAAPFEHIQAAVDSILDASVNKPYVINIAPFTYPEAQVDLTDKPFISLKGQDGIDTIISNGVLYSLTAPNGNLFFFENLTFGTSSIDMNNDSNGAFKANNCFFMNLDFDGGPQANNNQGFFYDSIAILLNIINGRTFLYGAQITNTLNIQDGDGANVYCIGSILLDTSLNIFGRAAIIAIGSLMLTDVTGTIASATTPTYLADDAGLNLLGANIFSGDVKIGSMNNVYRSVAADYDIRNERLLDVDATGANTAANLPQGSQAVGRIITIKKTDVTANTVDVTPFAGDDIEGNPSVSLAAQWDSVTLMSTGGTSWRILSTT